MRKMKDSGAKWIGKIPSTWQSDKLKYHLKRKEPKNPGDMTVLSLYRELGIIPKDSRDDNHNQTSEDTSKYKYVKPGNFVVNKMKAWQGSVAVSDYEGIVSPAYYVYEFTDELFDKRYFHHLLRGCYKDEFMRLSGGMRVGQWDLSSEDLDNTVIVIPPIDEQKKIAEFLDAKCSEIDALVADIQAQIETLEQYKRSTVIETVLKGLKPRLPTKDSKIDWVGTIPSHWNTHPMYYYFEECKHINSLGEENNLLSLSYGKVIRKDINTNGGLLPNNFNTYNIIEKDDIVLRLTDLQNDRRSLRTGIAKERGIITSAYVTLRATKVLNAQYFYYLLHAYDLMKVLYNMGSGVRQGLNYEELSKMMLIEPSLDEQNEIATFLDKKCSEINTCIEEKKEQIATLDAYKKSIIFEYVTGKKEVAQ